MVSKKVKVINPQGLHMRPAQLFVAEMAKYDSTVTILFGEKTINAKSIMNLMASCIKMEALDAAVKLVESGLGDL